MRTPALLSLLLLVGLAAPLAAQIPDRPEDIEFPPLEFTPPDAAAYRHELPNGVPVYLAPSHEFPLVEISFRFKGGSDLEPAELTGLGGTLGAMMRRGGTTTVSAEDLDERFDFLAADVSAQVGGESSGASINCLKSNLDEAFGLFVDMVRHPGFDAERLRIHKDQLIEGFKQRNDNPQGVAFPRMRQLLYGPDTYLSREATQASVEAIDDQALSALHARIFNPSNLIIAATGDFEPDEMLAFLGKALESWEAGEKAPDPPAPDHVLEPGLYHAATTQADLPQGTEIMFQRCIARDDPDAIPMQVMNDILGGGGFTSRITNRVRSDEGLAYTAVSFLMPQVEFPGAFGAFFQSKNETVALATKLTLEEIGRIRSEPVSDEELSRAKNGFIQQFPQRFASKSTMLGTFVNDELTHRPKDHWKTYRDDVAAVTKEDVMRVAKEHLHPDGLAILVVGDWDAIAPGDHEGRANMGEFYGGQVHHLPMLDPLTREPMDSGSADTGS